MWAWSLQYELTRYLWMQSADLDVKATSAQIKQYIMNHSYLERPEGSELPEYDQSTDVGLAYI